MRSLEGGIEDFKMEAKSPSSQDLEDKRQEEETIFPLQTAFGPNPNAIFTNNIGLSLSSFY